MSKYKTSYGKFAVNRKNKYASDCGAGKEGSGGFQPGNTCGGTGKGDGAEDPKKKKPKKSDTGSGKGGMSQEAIDAYKDISHADIDNMLEEKDITQDEAKLMREYVDAYQAQSDTGSGEGGGFYEEYNGHDIELVDDGDGDWSLLIDGNQEAIYNNLKDPNFDLIQEEGKKLVDGMDEPDTGSGEGYDETPGADAPSKEDIEAMEGLDTMQPDTGADEGGEDWRDQEVRTGYTGKEPEMEKWGDLVSSHADYAWDSQGNMYEGQVLKLNSKDDVQWFLDYTWTDKTGESIAPQGFVDAVWDEVEKNLKVLGDEFDDDGNRTNAPEADTGSGEARIETDVAIPKDEPTDAYDPSKMESKTREVDSIRGHKIMPKELSSKVPSLGSQDGKGKDAIVYAKFFDPQGSATWYMTEFDPTTGEAFGYADMFGSGDSQSAEMGYFNVWEIGQTMGKMGIPMERDNYWTEKTINESIAE